MGASDDYESNWFKQCIASGIGFFSGYKLVKYFYPEYATQIYGYGVGAITFMIGMTSAQTSAWTMLLGAGVASATFMAPTGVGLLGSMFDSKHKETFDKAETFLKGPAFTGGSKKVQGCIDEAGEESGGKWTHTVLNAWEPSSSSD